MKAVTKKTTCIIAIILAFCLLVAGLYLLVWPNGSIFGKNNNNNNGDDGIIKPSNIDLKEYSIEMGKAWKGDHFEYSYTGKKLPIVGNTDFKLVGVAWNNVWVYYKQKGADDSTYTTEAPTNVGEYVVKVFVQKTSDYQEFNKTYDYVITKQSIPAAVLNGDVYYDDGDGLCFHKTYTGKRLAITKDDIKVGSDEITKTMKISYRKATATNGDYTTTAPKAVGVYEVKVVVPETETRNGYEAIFIYKIEE